MISSDTWGFTVGMRSDIGAVRKANEDSGYADASMALIADGVGGGPCGALASSTVISTLVEQLSSQQTNSEKIREALVAANTALRCVMAQQAAARGMATTLTGLVRDAGNLVMMHIGDSRLYRVRDAEIIQVSRDDSWVQLLMDQGQLTADEVKFHPLRSMLLNSLAGNISDPADVHVAALDARVGDRWILATDGLTDYCDPTVFTSQCTQANHPQQIADALITQCRLHSHDNLSVIVADISMTPQRRGGYLGAAAEQSCADIAGRVG